MEHVRQRAVLYVRASVVLAYPEKRAEAGFFIASEPYILISALEPAELGRALFAALGASQGEVPAPKRTEWREGAAVRLRAASAKSEAAFMRGARLVSVERSRDEIELVPHQNGGSAGSSRGFIELPEHRIMLAPDVNDAMLGAACLEALNSCC